MTANFIVRKKSNLKMLSQKKYQNRSLKNILCSLYVIIECSPSKQYQGHNLGVLRPVITVTFTCSPWVTYLFSHETSEMTLSFYPPPYSHRVPVRPDLHLRLTTESVFFGRPLSSPRGRRHGQQLFSWVQTWPSWRGQPRGGVPLLITGAALPHGAERRRVGDQDQGELRRCERTVCQTENVTYRR